MDIENFRQKPNVLITGTPGVGKTTLGKMLAQYIEGMNYINVGDLVNEKKLYKTWNEEYGVPEFDEDMVVDELEDLMQVGGVIIDFHSSNFFPERVFVLINQWFDLVVLLRTDNTTLYDRLAARGYDQKKISENIECEILEVTKEEVEQSYNGKIIMELQNVEVKDLESNIMLIIQYLQQWKQQQQQQ